MSNLENYQEKNLLQCATLTTTNNLKQTKTTTMKTEIETTKKIMNLLLECVKDKNISIKERNVYYSEYLQFAKNLLILSK